MWSELRRARAGIAFAAALFLGATRSIGVPIGLGLLVASAAEVVVAAVGGVGLARPAGAAGAAARGAGWVAGPTLEVGSLAAETVGRCDLLVVLYLGVVVARPLGWWGWGSGPVRPKPVVAVGSGVARSDRVGWVPTGINHQRVSHRTGSCVCMCSPRVGGVARGRCGDVVDAPGDGSPVSGVHN